MHGTANRRLRPACSLAASLLLWAAGASATETVYRFDSDATGVPPTGWEVASGTWSVQADALAPSQPNSLAQTGKEGAAPFNVVLAPTPPARGVVIELSFRAQAGQRDQGGGPVWRYQDVGNYYVCRYNPLESNFRLYRVEHGRRVQLKSVDLTATPGWHRIAVEMIGAQIRCSLDGRTALEAADSTFLQPGRSGLWTKADAQTAFDDLTITSLDDPGNGPPRPSHGQLK